MSLSKAKTFFCPLTSNLKLLARQNPHRALTSATPQHDVESDDKPQKDQKHKNLRPLDVVFKESVGLIPKEENNEAEIENEANELKRELYKLEREVRELDLMNKNEANEEGQLKKLKNRGEGKRSLFKLFTEKKDGIYPLNDGGAVYEELSSDAKKLVSHLYEEGYFKDANFLVGGKLDYSCFETGYARDFLKFAVERFGKDHQGIAKWLSGSDLKKVAIFGCPTLEKKSMFAAKRLRRFFEIQEDTICRDCVLKRSCKAANLPSRKGSAMKVMLADVMKIITRYSLDWVHPQLKVPEEVKASVSKLLHEVLKLSHSQDEP